MSSYQPNSASYQSHAAPHLPIPAYNPVAAMAAPAGTFLPGTKVQVGSHRVVVEKYLSEGGFAHVYVVRLPQPVDGSDRAVLKRVAVPDKSALANMRTEVETMKKLKGHRHIVTYIDSHASQLRGGGYEVFLLMEFCDGGGLIDFMNTRLQNRLTEPEIIKIFSDVAEGVACMHYLKPPLLHRDLKVENVLISRQGSAALYKLCDFGSTAPPRPAATSAAEGRLIEDDVQRHTTLQYRSPEMIDVYRKQPIDEKSDIWALGVLLYKLCYYTTPFEEVGQMAILNASYKFPSYPVFSDRLKMLIAWMLKELPQKRPNIYEVVREVCHMQGKDVPISDIYAARSTSEARRFQELPPSPTEAPQVGAVFSPPIQETQIIPEIAPMRRGRPTRPTQSPHHSTKPSPSPYRGSGDPFSVLDNAQRSRNSTDEFTNRFPSLDQFQILHEKGGKFDFESAVPESSPDDEDLARRLTNALADDAFAKHQSPGPEVSASQRPTQPTSTQSAPVERADNVRDEGRASVPLYQPAPQRPAMVSTGTMTSPPATPGVPDYPPSSRPVFKFPPADHQRRPSSHKRPSESDLKNKAPSPATNAVVQPRGSSDRISDLSASPRPSLEGGRPSNLEVDDSVGRSRSANGRSRPVSVHAGARYDLPRGSESARSSLDLPRSPYEGGAPLQHARTEMDSRANISSDVDYLRAREEESNKKREKRYSGTAKHGKRSSLSTLSLSGTKMFAGRFGDAFRRFEHSNSDSKVQSPVTEEAPIKSPMTLTSADLTAEPASELINMDDNEDISPEMRRELERRRLSQEEKRVASAAAEYRRRVAEGGQSGSGGGWRETGPRSQAIQSKVQSLLGESTRAAPPPKTATGYGRYTDEAPAAALPAKPTLETTRPTRGSAPLPPPPLEQPTGGGVGQQQQQQQQQQQPPPQPTTTSGRPGSSSGAPRPALPPKPKSLRMPTGMEGQQQGSSSYDRSPTVAATPATPGGDDWEANFSRRFPSLSGLEVETEIELPRVAPNSLRTKEV
ncbi:putative serine/threonine protein kinase [Aspergillus homomorphus CBS 101889]|uniref:non-specific serine/threonine protein kinase n=1 Tax=Aspergillus homomorphus (strain CBS 101889) TaxID=1450537 RepID=A0A395HQD8_ASPHC|nr:hypothetical protein BO97DRAFT_445050 [Aspergillus homomorphus CBS 101889]RAL09960.1 hypothetical protein BO97DRAFT_445050 [Aspergillus homomorphus CBS 101889]